MKLILSLAAIFFGTSFTLTAQLIDNRIGNAFEDEMFFNEEFIRENGIRSISSESFVKHTNRPMRLLTNEEIFQFTDEGKLKKLYKIRQLFGKSDTLHMLWDYNEGSKVVELTETDDRGFYIIKSIRDEEGRVKQRKFFRVKNASGSKKRIEPSNEYLVNKESYQYRMPNDTTQVKVTLNNHGLPFKEETVVKNGLGYIVMIRKKYLVSNQWETRLFEYNNNGWVTSVITEYFPATEKEEKKFEYDKFGNLLSIKFIKGEQVTHVTELIYSEAMLLHSTIHRELETNIMDIKKYYYEFK